MNAGDYLAQHVFDMNDAQIKSLDNAEEFFSGIAGAVSQVSGYIAVAKSILEMCGVFKTIDPIQQAVTALEQHFDAVLSAATDVQKMRDVANQIEDARSQLGNLHDDAPDDASTPGDSKHPNWPRESSDVITHTRTVVNTLGDPAYWRRPFFPEAAYLHSNPFDFELNWTQSPTPPGADSGIVFDYRLTLSAYLEAIVTRITVLAAMVPGFRDSHQDELQEMATTLEGYFKTIRDGIVESQPPAADKISGPPFGNWFMVNRRFGAVDIYSTVNTVDSWPDEWPQSDIGDDRAYWMFSVRYLIRTLAGWKQVYNQIGLPSAARVLMRLKALAGISPVTLDGRTGDWSVRELAQRLGAIPNSGFTPVWGQPISLRAVLLVLHTVREDIPGIPSDTPPFYFPRTSIPDLPPNASLTSLRAAVTL